MHRGGRVGLLLSVLLLCSCAAAPRPEPVDEIQAAVREGIRSADEAVPGTVPDSVSSALLPPIRVTVPEADLGQAEQRFDVKVRRVEARDFFLSLVDGTPYNMVVHPDVAGRITLDLKNVTVPEVLQVVRNVYGYDFEKTATGFQVLPKALRSRLFQVDYLNVKRTARSRTQANPSQITLSTGRQRSSGSATAGSTTQSGGTGQTILGSSIDTESESDFWSEIAASIRQVIGTAEGRSVSVNPQAGLVMVRAMPNELRDVEALLDTTQQVVQRQVIIEARVLEVELNEGSQTGINWAQLRSANGNSGVLGLGTGRGTSFSGSAATVRDNIAASAGRTINSTAEFGGPFTVAVNTGSFTAFIDMLRTQGDVQVLSRPRVSAVNNQKAVIKVGSDEFFVTEISTTSTATVAGTTTGPNVTLTPFFSGVTLDVIPQISAAGEIILHVHPAVSEVTEQVKNIGVSATATLNVPLASSTIRESDTIVRAKSGQVIVLGGLMQNSSEDEEQAVPFFGSLPVLGMLFRHTQKVKRKSELVILLKPTVVDGDTWSQELKRSADTFEELRR